MPGKNHWVLIQTETAINDPITPEDFDKNFKKNKKSSMLEPGKVVFYSGPSSPLLGRVEGKVPHSRDGHSAVLYENAMIVFGGDRHQMGFNDLYCYYVREHNQG